MWLLIDEGIELKDRYKFGTRGGVGANVEELRGGGGGGGVCVGGKVAPQP